MQAAPYNNPKAVIKMKNNRDVEKKPTKGEWVYLILSVCAPLLYFALCLPWNGEVYLIGDDPFSIAIFVLQCLALITSVTQLILRLMKKEYSCMLCVASCLLTVLSFSFLCFFGFFFLLELFNVPWFPAQR